MIGNAIRFIERGEVAVNVEVDGAKSSESTVQLRISVRDTGIGISRDKQEMILGVIRQNGASDTRGQCGLGLGLVIASRLVELMAGQLSVESTSGKGSVFTFTARFFRRPEQAHIHRAAVVRPPVRSVRRLKILLVDDNEFSRHALQRLLMRQGHRIWSANNGQEALARLRLSAPPSDASEPNAAIQFDLLLLDVQIPVSDGLQVIQAVREQERVTGRHLPVIAVTANARSEVRERCLAAGMDAYLAKPVSAENICSAIDRLVVKQRVAQSPPPRTEASAGLIDAPVLLAACANGPIGLAELCRDFEIYAPGRLDEVTDALLHRDFVRLGLAAHRLSGLLSAYSTSAGKAASDLEDIAGNAGRLEEATALVTERQAIVEDLRRLVPKLSIESLRPATTIETLLDQNPVVPTWLYGSNST